MLCLCLAAVFSASPAGAAEWSGGRLSMVDGPVFFQPAREIDWSHGEINLLVESGDRLVTGEAGRLEVQLAGKDILRLWHDTEIALVDLDGTVSLQIGTGSLYVRSPSRYSDDCGLRIVTPEATICTSGRTLLRVDVAVEGRTVVSVIKGRAEVGVGGELFDRDFFGDLFEGDSLSLGSARQAQVTGAVIEGPFRFDTQSRDPFMRWCESRDRSITTAESSRYLQIESPGAWDLDRHGSWTYVQLISTYVWRPIVSVGWSPYCHGRWIWSGRHGWTWVSYEPWGWIPYHYGSWTWISDLGWVWIPGRTWAGAHVDWVACGEYVGWRPSLHRLGGHPGAPWARHPGAPWTRHHPYCFAHRDTMADPVDGIRPLDDTYLRTHQVEPIEDPGAVVRPESAPRSSSAKIALPGTSRATTGSGYAPVRSGGSAQGGTRSPNGSGAGSAPSLSRWGSSGGGIPVSTEVRPAGKKGNRSATRRSEEATGAPPLRRAPMMAPAPTPPRGGTAGRIEPSSPLPSRSSGRSGVRNAPERHHKPTPPPRPARRLDRRNNTSRPSKTTPLQGSPTLNRPPSRSPAPVPAAEPPLIPGKRIKPPKKKK